MKSIIPLFSVLAGFLVLSSMGGNQGKSPYPPDPVSDQLPADTTEPEGLYFRLGEIVRTGDTITAVSLELLNTRTDSVTVVCHTLKDAGGEELLRNEELLVISPEVSVTWAVGFPEPPTQEQFDQFTVEWVVKYFGETWLKTNRMGKPDQIIAETE